MPFARHLFRSGLILKGDRYVILRQNSRETGLRRYCRKPDYCLDIRRSARHADPPTASSAPKPVAVVDVVAQLEQRAAANPQKLNWRTSIVDLLKLLDMDSSLTERKKLAAELGCPADLMGDSAKMNIWLHKTVLARIAENGGNVPKDLLD
jgi:hypothetical protein